MAPSSLAECGGELYRSGARGASSTKEASKSAVKETVEGRDRSEGS